MNKKLSIALIALALIVGVVAGTTVAFLTATSSVTNTFTSGNVSITLEEPGAPKDNKYEKIAAGQERKKDPTVTVKANSEASYIFVECIASADFFKYFEELKTNEVTTSGKEYKWVKLVEADFKTAGGTALPNDVYVLVVGKEAAATSVVPGPKSDTKYQFLKGSTTNPTGCVKVRDSFEGFTGEQTLTFNAGAIQAEGLASAEKAWLQLAGADGSLADNIAAESSAESASSDASSATSSTSSDS